MYVPLNEICHECQFYFMIVFFLQNKKTQKYNMEQVQIYIIFFYSIFFLNKSLKQSFSSSDPKEIVIDEFIGQSIPLILCENNFFLIILSFLLFRLFDITKPWPASYFDLKVKSANGVLMDDIIAGLYTFFLIYLWV